MYQGLIIYVRERERGGFEDMDGLAIHKGREHWGVTWFEGKKMNSALYIRV